MMRAIEYDVTRAGCAPLGLQHRHPEWVAAADFTQSTCR